MTIHIEKDAKRNLTVFTVIGRASTREIIEALSSAMSKDATKKVLWDFSKANGKMTKMMGAELKKLIETAHTYHNPRRTAVVATDPVIYGLSRMAEAQVEQYEIEAFCVFKSLLDAFVWLENDKQIL